jgi:hypothetical protein
MIPPRECAVKLMRSLGMTPDPWQIDVLESDHPRLLLNCSRQAGKSTTVAVLALAEVMFRNDALVLLLSRSHRQACELFRKVTEFHRRLKEPLLHRRNADELLLANGSRVVCLPCKGETIRGYSGVDLLILDEAARVPDDVYCDVRPMLAVSAGRMICLSTPWGKRGFFWNAWVNGGDDFARIEIPASKIPRIPEAFLFAERRALGDVKFRREYCCSFEAIEGLVLPDFARCEVAGPAPTAGKRVGGIDFGFRNPFAAVWGVLGSDGILWLTGEHYSRGKPLSFHATQLPRGYTWYADPSGANERAELHVANHHVVKADNAIGPGLARITARLEAGALRVVSGHCPNLLKEAELYCYSTEPNERHAEIPVDEHNHAISALRYLLSILDARRMAGQPRVVHPDDAPARPARQFRTFRELCNDPAVWTPMR